MQTIIIDRKLRFYVIDAYAKHADVNGGHVFKPFYKKELKPFKTMVKYAVNRPGKVIEKAKYLFSLN